MEIEETEAGSPEKPVEKVYSQAKKCNRWGHEIRASFAKIKGNESVSKLQRRRRLKSAVREGDGWQSKKTPCEYEGRDQGDALLARKPANHQKTGVRYGTDSFSQSSEGSTV